ncbi:MAG: hypothetical protein REI09_06335 [Candidatus Dactylopiibacterium sp.]|nr:hypothetical protein [Candidatus Dactylopiibacterium sp.]
MNAGKVAKIFAFVGILCAAMGYLSPSFFGGVGVKKRLLDEVRPAREEDVSIDLQKFSAERIRKLCIQSTYMTKEAMEGMAGEKMDGFSVIVDDGFFVLWVFREKRIPWEIRFRRGSELGFGYESVCTTRSAVRVVKRRLYLDGGE